MNSPLKETLQFKSNNLEALRMQIMQLIYKIEESQKHKIKQLESDQRTALSQVGLRSEVVVQDLLKALGRIESDEDLAGFKKEANGLCAAVRKAAEQVITRKSDI